MKNFFFWFGCAVAILLALIVVPGLDILAWHLLKPSGFVQRAIVLAIEWISLWPRVILGFLIWVGVSKLSLALFG